MEKEQIEKTRQKFDSILHTDGYKKIHSDEKHLRNLLNLFELKPDCHYLDLGTGNGYLAFALAEKNKSIFVEGLDIVENSIMKNKQIVKEKGLKNIKFEAYDGINFPYPDGFFSGGISRYAMHHFPNINHSIREINRVLEKGGFFILSDAKTYDIDKKGFIDEFQKFLEDGHNHFYYENEIIELFNNQGFIKEKIFDSYIRYPRKYNKRYQDLIDGEAGEVVNKYKMEVVDDNIFMTVQIMNILFRKIKP
ncbi:class I SAM-dependent methyltransferase [candidate division WOR-3 bacterium]|nr:class I SAM-dependent methyltransferase [candidate division WOR-3 bacterium]